MHIGMIVGIGPAATDFYYRHLISAMAKEGRDLQLTMAHADTSTLLRHQTENNQEAQVAIYLQLTERLMRCGIERIAITSIGPSTTIPDVTPSAILCSPYNHIPRLKFP